MRKRKEKKPPEKEELKDDDILITLEVNEDETEAYLILRKKTKIDLKDLILSLEEYLTELTRADKQISSDETNIH